MTNETKLKNLKISLKIYGVLTILIMCINFSAFIFRITAFNPGEKFHWLIWDDVYGHVGPMIFIVYIVWGFYFFIIAKDPLKNRTFLDFTMWANLAHGLVMIPMAWSDEMYHSKFLTDIPFMLSMALVIYLFRPDKELKQAGAFIVK